MSDSDFIFIELAGLENANAFDGLAAGSFTDMRGKRVTFNADDLPLYISNTQGVLESTRTEKGELVGLPIDMDGHDHKGGAGWITGFQLDQQRGVIRFIPNWTEDGKDLIAGNKRRYFSPTVDPTQKVILGGALTNYPASRDANYRMKLRPIELSEQIQEIDMENTFSWEKLSEFADKLVDAIKGRKAEPAPEQPKENDMPELTLAEFMQTPEAIAELERRTNERAAALLQAEQLKNKVADFSKRITSGEAYGLAMKAEELTAAILALPEAEKVLDLVEKLANAKIANFQEKGSGGHKEEESKGGKLPEEIKPLVQKWVEAGKDAAEFFTVNPELGMNAAEYDLSEFKQEK